MKPCWLALMLAALIGLGLPLSDARAQGRDQAVMLDALDVLNDMGNMVFKHLPPALLRDARGVVIVPGMVKAGFIIGARHGRGVLLARDANDVWMRPEILTMTGGGIGWQAGVQSIDLVLVFKTRASLDRLRRGKFTLGADASVAAGPVGRQAEAATDAMLKSEIFSYSRSRGLFAGVSLEGAVIRLDPFGTDLYYRQELPAAPVPGVPGAPPVPPPSARLQFRLAQLTGPMVEQPGPGVPPIAVPAGPALPVIPAQPVLPGQPVPVPQPIQPVPVPQPLPQPQTLPQGQPLPPLPPPPQPAPPGGR